ncbi:MAG: Hsp70 family protein [Anaerolineae bacterium]
MIIGMDFGTTNSGIATYDGSHLRVIPIDGSNTIARTALYVTNDRQFYIGREAIDTYFTQNLNRPVKIERVRVGEIALTFAEIGSFVRDVYIDKDVLSPGRLFVSFKTALSSLDYLGTVVGSNFYFLEDIIALYLHVAKRRAEAALQTEIRQIALGRPVRFAFKPEDDALARERLLKAAFRAGYEEVYLQYEPVAAAYHYESTIDREETVLVFDFGGGTLDISVLRVGNPKTRAVLATGGVPIAGDIFDSKLSRARLPKHFGEGSAYRSAGKRLPVPSSFYEPFSNWQEMLALQRPDLFQQIERIAHTAQRPQQIRALLKLISSSYGLKMFDIVEGAKRQLSQTERAVIHLQGSGFDVYEPISRGEFEAVIGPEIRLIEEYLDNLLRDAGLHPDDIDVVIRTGGSSQIPAFVHMLEARFGRERVRSVETFSSVTSGLGIIAHRIARGEIDAKVFRSRDFLCGSGGCQRARRSISRC